MPLICEIVTDSRKKENRHGITEADNHGGELLPAGIQEGVIMGQHQEPFLLGLLFALGLGIFAAHHMTAMPLLPVCLLLCGLLAAAAFGVHKCKGWAWLPFVLAAFVLGAGRLWSAETLPVADVSHLANEEVRIKGSVAEEPVLRKAADGSYRLRLHLEAEEARKGKAEATAAEGGLYVYGRFNEPPEGLPRIGDSVAVTGKVRLPQGYRNPGQLDTAMLLRSQGITATLSARGESLKIEEREGHGFKRWLSSVRAHYLGAMEEVMPKEDAAAIFAMLFGGYGGLQNELMEAFVSTGLVHILSVSGSHISLIAAVMAWLGMALRLSKGLMAVLVIGVIVVYSLLAGCVPPVIRSAIMGALAFVALSLDRERDARRILLLTGLFMLAVSPLLLFHISFQLSFLATAGLLYLAPVLRGWLKARHLGDFVSTGLAITMAAQLATLPVLAWYFNQLSLSSLLANMTIAPIVELIIVVGLFGGIIAFLLPFMGKIVYAGDSLLLGLVYEMARWMAKLPGSMIWIPTLQGWAGVAYYALLGYAVLDKPWQEKVWGFLQARRQYFLLAVLALLLFLGGRQLAHRGEMILAAVDVGQGDALVLQTPKGRVLLFDTGGTRDEEFDIGERVLVPYLRHYGMNRVEAVFLSHAHADHAEGTGAVLRRLSVGKVYTAWEGRGEYAKSFHMSEADPRLNKLEPAKQGTAMELDGVRVEVLYAPEVLPSGTGNEASNVYKITYGEASFLITGDLTKENEQVILAEQPEGKLRSTVLKVGHHGSDTSSSEEFLQAVRPSYAVICVGANNSFGHPKAKVLERLQGVGAEILRTDQKGEIKFCTDGRTMRVEAYIE